jgi:hypothetical protein
VRAGFDRERLNTIAADASSDLADLDTGDVDAVADGVSSTDTAPVLPDHGKPVHLIFATSTPLQGNLGGISGADGLCQKSAIAAGLSGTFKALISDSSTSARDRLTIGFPLHNTAGQLIATDTTDLWDGDVQNPIAYDEHGALVTSIFRVWNGTRDSGRAYAQNTCQDWTSSAQDDMGEIGMLNRKATWIDDSAVTCDKEGRLYCISQ